MTTVPTLPATLPVQRRAPALPTAEQVLHLQSVHGYPCVSLLMNTTPAPALTGADALRLDQLLDQASRRLRSEAQGEDVVAALATLERLVAEAAGGPTSTALALYADAQTTTALRLPVEVRERVVVDPTFATRDLVRSLHRTPRHVVLVLNSREARLFEGAGDQLRPARTSAFPMHDTREQQTQRGRADRGDDTVAFLRTVDRALTTYLRLHPAPLVLAGGQRTLATYTGLSANLARLAGSIPVNLSGEPLSVLAERIRPVMEDYLLSRQREALALLDKRVGARRAVAGMADCWLAARTDRSEMLAVEQGLFYPARISEDGDRLAPASDVEHPEVIDDAVDELIELVLDRGGWVALVDDGALAAHHGGRSRCVPRAEAALRSRHGGSGRATGEAGVDLPHQPRTRPARRPPRPARQAPGDRGRRRDHRARRAADPGRPRGRRLPPPHPGGPPQQLRRPGRPAAPPPGPGPRRRRRPGRARGASE